MTDYDFKPVVWVSLASVSGLSLVSLGQPGLRTDLDEQVYTGGLTAVQAMLGGEVGGDTGRFVAVVIVIELADLWLETILVSLLGNSY